MKFADLKFTVSARSTEQTSNIKHTHALRSEVTLVRGSFRLAPITHPILYIIVQSVPILPVLKFHTAKLYWPRRPPLTTQASTGLRTGLSWPTQIILAFAGPLPHYLSSLARYDNTGLHWPTRTLLVGWGKGRRQDWREGWVGVGR